MALPRVPVATGVASAALAGSDARQELAKLALSRAVRTDRRQCDACQFADLYSDPLPKHGALNRDFNRLMP